jgi:Flp pilus assembly protein CpaB
MGMMCCRKQTGINYGIRQCAYSYEDGGESVNLPASKCVSPVSPPQVRRGADVPVRSNRIYTPSLGNISSTIWLEGAAVSVRGDADVGCDKGNFVYPHTHFTVG